MILTWDERAKVRQHLVTRGGREIALKLPTGTRLYPATVLFVGDGFHVQVVAAEEEVWMIRVAETQMLARLAYEIGNRHFPIEIGDGWLVVRYDHTLAELWERLGVVAEQTRRPFLSQQRPAHHH